MNVLIGVGKIFRTFNKYLQNTLQLAPYVTVNLQPCRGLDKIFVAIFTLNRKGY